MLCGVNMNEADLRSLSATVADRLCGKHEHICVALIASWQRANPCLLHGCLRILPPRN